MGTPTRQRDGSYYVYDGTERTSMGLYSCVQRFAALLPVVRAAKLLSHASVGLSETSVRRWHVVDLASNILVEQTEVAARRMMLA